MRLVNQFVIRIGICLVGVVSDELLLLYKVKCVELRRRREIDLKELLILFPMRFILFVVPCALKICIQDCLF